MLAKLAAMGGTSQKLYVDDVFSTYLYQGYGSQQNIVNGIDLATQGGLIWTKCRSLASGHALFDTKNGITKLLSTSSASSASTVSQVLKTINNNGYTLDTDTTSLLNVSGQSYASWTIRRAPKFFDVVTWTGDGVAGRQIPHSLGIAPGLIVVKQTNTSRDWFVYHRSLGNGKVLQLNSTAASGAAPTCWNTTDPTASAFTVGNSTTVNGLGGSYVAYLFAHDPSADGIIQCGSATMDGSGNATVTLGWEPQFLLWKQSSNTGNWSFIDSQRGWTADRSEQILYPNLSNAEAAGGLGVGLNATGFFGQGAGVAGDVFIYLAIRRPNKPPTSGTQVYNAIARTGTGDAATVTGVGFAPDLYLGGKRTNFYSGFVDRLRGFNKELWPYSTSAETTPPSGQDLTGFLQDGVSVGTDSTMLINDSGAAIINHFFRRAPGFMDVVCYTGTGIARTVPHNLGVVPELMIVKTRSDANHWAVYTSLGAAVKALVLDVSDGFVTASAYWNNTPPTASAFTVGTKTETNQPGYTYVAYLFASLPGISKVGSFTKVAGSALNVDCGFTAGARFVLLKRTNAAGDWYVADTTRGLVAAADPYLLLNSTAAEVTTLDWIDPYAAGFSIPDGGLANGSYIFLAIA